MYHDTNKQQMQNTQLQQSIQYQKTAIELLEKSIKLQHDTQHDTRHDTRPKSYENYCNLHTLPIHHAYSSGLGVGQFIACGIALSLLVIYGYTP